MSRFAALVLCAAILCCSLAGCSLPRSSASGLDAGRIRSICSLATLECYYHNVAKSVKPAGSGITHWGEADRTFWIEYSGIITIGVDMTQLSVETDGSTIRVTLPRAKVLSVSVDEASISADSYISSGNGWNGNPITAADQTAAIRTAQEAMRSDAAGSSSLLCAAQDRARTLIESYINQVCTLSGADCRIEWILL